MGRQDQLAKFIVPDKGDKVDSGVGLSYRPARLVHKHRLTGRYTTTLCWSQTISPSRDYKFGYRYGQYRGSDTVSHRGLLCLDIGGSNTVEGILLLGLTKGRYAWSDLFLCISTVLHLNYREKNR